MLFQKVTFSYLKKKRKIRIVEHCDAVIDEGDDRARRVVARQRSTR